MRRQLVATVAACLLASPATALEFVFSYAGAGIAAAGTFTTTDVPDGSGYFTVIGLTGVRNGIAMTLLPPETFIDNDNLLRPAVPQLTLRGISFTANGSFNLFDPIDPVFNYAECDEAIQCFDVNLVLNGQPGVPEPATWVLLIGGFGLVGTAMRRRAAAAYASA